MFQSNVNTLSGVHVTRTFCISTYLTDIQSHVRVTQVKMYIDVNACTGEDWMKDFGCTY